MSEAKGNRWYTWVMAGLVLLAVGAAFRLGVIVEHAQNHRRTVAFENDLRLREQRAAEQRRQLLQYIPQQRDQFHAE